MCDQMKVYGHQWRHTVLAPKINGFLELGLNKFDRTSRVHLDHLFACRPYTFYDCILLVAVCFQRLISFPGTIWYFSDLFDSLIRLLTVLTDPVMFPTSINGNLTKIDIYNKKVIEGFMLEYKQSFHSALLWVKLREKIAQFLRKESTKSSPGMTNFIFRVLTKIRRCCTEKAGIF